MVRLPALPSPGVLLSSGCWRYYGWLRLPLGWLADDPCSPVFSHERECRAVASARRPRRVSPVPRRTLPAFRVLYPGGFLTAALPRASPLPWPSPVRRGLGSLLAARGGGCVITRPQTSLGCYGLQGCLPSLSKTLSAGFSGGFSPTVAALLPGGWDLTGTGLAPASPTRLVWMYRPGT